MQRITSDSGGYDCRDAGPPPAAGGDTPAVTEPAPAGLAAPMQTGEATVAISASIMPAAALSSSPRTPRREALPVLAEIAENFSEGDAEAVSS